MKIIETIYRGCRFRSRLEARWAVFMDSLGVSYQYEPEGYELGDGIFYLPDFWLPTLKAHLEIKPIYPTAEEEEKAQHLAISTKYPTYIFFGTSFVPDFGTSDSAIKLFPDEDGGWDNCHWWCECPTCGRIGIEYTGRAERIECKCDVIERCGMYETPRLLHAYETAAGFRFY